MFYLLLVPAIIILDQSIKYIINSKIHIRTSIPVFKKVFYITHYENTGMALSFFENKGYIFMPIMIILLFIVVYFFFTSQSFLIKLSLSFILAGGTGNLLDRLLKGSVTDFVEIHLGSFLLPIFNIADMFIFVGTIILVLN
ncbi:MAG TPA: signal peptidase II [Clostridiaceae bacterium]